MHKPQATLRTGRHMPRSTRRGPGPPRARSAATPLKTTKSRVTALGDAIREHPGYSPILLPETPNGIGTAVVTLEAGADPFCRLRVPEITEQWAAARAAATTASRLVAPVPLAEPDSAGNAQPWSSRPASALRSLQRWALSWPNSGRRQLAERAAAQAKRADACRSDSYVIILCSNWTRTRQPGRCRRSCRG